MIEDDLKNGRDVPDGLTVVAMVQGQVTQGTAKDAADLADGETKALLKWVLGKLGRIGDRLMSMNLHLLTVKEWSLEAGVNLGVAQGSISVTFGGVAG